MLRTRRRTFKVDPRSTSKVAIFKSQRIFAFPPAVSSPATMSRRPMHPSSTYKVPSCFSCRSSNLPGREQALGTFLLLFRESESRESRIDSMELDRSQRQRRTDELLRQREFRFRSYFLEKFDFSSVLFLGIFRDDPEYDSLGESKHSLAFHGVDSSNMLMTSLAGSLVDDLVQFDLDETQASDLEDSGEKSVMRIRLSRCC